MHYKRRVAATLNVSKADFSRYLNRGCEASSFDCSSCFGTMERLLRARLGSARILLGQYDAGSVMHSTISRGQCEALCELINENLKSMGAELKAGLGEVDGLKTKDCQTPGASSMPCVPN